MNQADPCAQCGAELRQSSALSLSGDDGGSGDERLLACCKRSQHLGLDPVMHAYAKVPTSTV